MAKKKKKRIKLDMARLEALQSRAQAGTWQEGDAALIEGLIECVKTLGSAVDEKAATIKNLLRTIFGPSTEKKRNFVKDEPAQDSDEADRESGSGSSKPSSSGKPGKPRKGHGRNGAKDYPGAEEREIKHPTLQAGSSCPACFEGKLYLQSEPGVEIRITGVTPVQAVIYKREKLRCQLCQAIFTAPMPAEAPTHKYDASAVAMIALLKYGSGMPFNRLANLQDNLGIPLPPSTQWEQVNEQAQKLIPVFDELVRQAAEGEVLHNDDTSIKVLSLIQENKQKQPKRTGMFTTGIVSLYEDKKIILFFSGRHHAGENLNKTLSHRDKAEKPPPLQMCDGLDRNIPTQFKTILLRCLVHARRNFVKAAPNFPQACERVLEILAKVYQFDARAKEKQLSPEERLAYHQENSLPLMDELHAWLQVSAEDESIEKNSSLGQAISYMIKHWTELTVFLRIPNAPLDNNICERALKKVVLHRKNGLFFKTENGALTADLYMSLICTCESAGVNAFEYLTALMENPEQIQTAPAQWMPWNFKETLSQLTS